MATRAPNSLMKKPVTDWVSYTPGTLQGFGTCTNIEVKSRRVGDSLEIQGRFVDGTPTASEARMSIGYNGVDANVTTANNSKLPSAGPQIVGKGTMGQNSGAVSVLAERNVTYLTFGLDSLGGGGAAKANGNVLVGTGMAFTFYALVPIQGW